MGKLLVLLTLTTAICAAKDELASRKPVFQYRYQTEDVMQTAASTIPVKGYHVVEGGYYPAEIGIGAGIGGGGIGGAGIGGAGIGGAGLAGAGIAGAGMGGAGMGGAGLGYKNVGYGGYGGYGGGIGIGGAGIGLGGAGIGGGKFIGGPGLYGAGLIGAGGAGLIGPGGGALIHAGGAGLGGAGLYGAGLGGAGLGGAALIGGGGAGGAGVYGGGLYGPALYGGGAGIVGGPFIHGIGGEVIDRGVYGGGKKILNDVAFEKASGQRGEEFDAGKEGFQKGVAAVKNNKGEHAYYNDAAAGKKLVDDAKTYYGGQHFDNEGAQGGEFNEKKAHKKGHKIKGFKTSHHKDETGKTEEYYDEENDEGGKINFSGTHGSFGEKGASSFKGGHENGEFLENGHKKQGHFDSEHLVDHNNADLGKYGEKKYGGSGAVFGVNNGIDQHSLLGHQENSKIYKHFPHHVPFY